MRKRFFSLVLATIVVLAFGACGSVSLQDWLNSDAGYLEEVQLDSTFSRIGVTTKLKADGNTLIIEFYDNDNILDSPNLDSFVEDLAAGGSMGAMFKNFKDHKIKLEAIRFVIYSSDGTELAAAEVTPDDLK